MKRGNRWLALVGVLLAGFAMAAPARAQVVVNGVNEGTTYTVPSGGLSAAAESIGFYGGTLNQSQGQNNVSGAVEIGLGESVPPFFAFSGTYNLSGGLLHAGTESLGIGNGNGTFDQTNGTNAVGTLSVLGQTAASGTLHGSGTYILGGGLLTASVITLGESAATDHATFAFNGGTADFRQMQIYQGAAVTSSGNEVLDAANPTNTMRSVVQFGGSNTVTGTFELGVSGTTTIAGGVVIGYTPNSDTYQLNGGSLSAANEALGIGGNAQLVQNGGTNTVQAGGTLTIGSAGTQVAPGIGGGGVASYDLAQGTLTAPTISVADSGTLQFNGGAIDFGQLTSLGTLSASGNEVLDRAGAANTTYHLFQNHGTNTVTGALEVGASGTTPPGGAFTGNSGYYNLSAASQLSAAAEVIGLAGTGSFIQTAATNTIASTGTVTLSDGSTLAGGTLMLGDTATGSGTYRLGGSGSQLTATNEVVGNNGSGSFSQLAGTNSTGSLVIAQGSGTGSYTLSGGTLAASGNVTVNANGSFGFDGGTLQTNELAISGGTVTATGDEQLTGIGAGAIVATLQTGGSNTVTAGTLYVTSGPGQSGSYRLQGGTISALAETVAAGLNGFTQSGGSNTVNTLSIDSTGPGSVGGYQLNGGVLHAGTINVASTGSLTMGNFGSSVDFGQLTLAGTMFASGNEVLDNPGQAHASYAVTQTGGTNLSLGALELGAATGNSGSYTLSAGTLSAAAEVIGPAGTGSVTQTGGTNTLTGTPGAPVTLANGTIVNGGTLTLGLNTGSSGTYALQGGTLSGNVAVSANGTFNLSGGTQQGQITNNGLFAETTGGSVGTLTNNATATVAGTLTASQVTNAGLFTLGGGTVTTTNGFENDSTLSGFGSIAGTGGFLNTNLFTQSGGSVTLAATGTNDNTGEIDLAAGTTTPFQIATGSTLSNDGLIKLNGGTLSGGGTLINATGVIGGTGRIGVAQFRNQGTLTADAGLTSLSGTVINGGIIQLTGTGALLTGGIITNTGTIEGVGRINNSIGNLGGSIQALGGTLTLGGPVTTTGATTLLAASGGQLLLAGAFTDEGTISLAGGSFDSTSGQTITNSGTISGYGSFAATALANSHTILVAGGTATFNTAITNNVGGTITVDHAAAVFNGAVTNNGTIHTNFGTASYASTFTNNGTVISDPSTQTFTGDLVEGTTGVIQAAAGDRYVVEGGFLNHSTQNTAWNTAGAILELAAGGASTIHTLALAGADLGIGSAGYQNNFAWNTLAIDSLQSLSLSDGVSAANVAFYTDVLSGAQVSGNSILNISGNGFNIYYDPLFAANAYLGGLTYTLANGGQLIADSVPTPEPATGALLAGFVLILAGLRPRRRLTGPA